MVSYAGGIVSVLRQAFLSEMYSLTLLAMYNNIVRSAPSDLQTYYSQLSNYKHGLCNCPGKMIILL